MASFNAESHPATCRTFACASAQARTGSDDLLLQTTRTDVTIADFVAHLTGHGIRLPLDAIEPDGGQHIFGDIAYAVRLAGFPFGIAYQRLGEVVTWRPVGHPQTDAQRQIVAELYDALGIDPPALGEAFDTEGNEWPQPQPLPDGLPLVPPFDYGLLPGSLQPWARDIVERMQCPAEYVAVAIMTTLGAVIGRKVGIRPQAKTDWTVVCNQWGLLVGRPATMKSPALEQALEPLKRLVERARDRHEAAVADYRRAIQATKLRADVAAKVARAALANDLEADITDFLVDDHLDEPVLNRYVSNDTTAAALGELLRHNPNGLLIHRDEIVSLLRGLDREDNSESRGFYLTGWNGDSAYTFDRIGRGLNLHVPAVCLSLLGSTQPSRIAEYLNAAVRGGAGDDGLIQRFGLFVWPDPVSSWQDVDRLPDREARNRAYEVFLRLADTSPEQLGAERDTGPDGGFHGVPYLRLDPAGLALFQGWRAELERQLRTADLHPALESHFAKYRKLIPGLALILHLADGNVGPVGAPAMRQALGWHHLLQAHARRAYASVMTVGVTAAKAIVQRIRRGDLPCEFAGWQVWRPGWSGLTDRTLVTEALALLVDYGWLVQSRRETTGRPATVYQVNPLAVGP